MFSEHGNVPVSSNPILKILFLPATATFLKTFPSTIPAWDNKLIFGLKLHLNKSSKHPSFTKSLKNEHLALVQFFMNIQCLNNSKLNLVLRTVNSMIFSKLWTEFNISAIRSIYFVSSWKSDTLSMIIVNLRDDDVIFTFHENRKTNIFERYKDIITFSKHL